MDNLLSPLPARRRLLVLAAGLLGAAALTPLARAADYRQISWDDLVPKDWDPMKSFDDVRKLGALPDSDPRVQQLYERMREVWDNAPPVPQLAGQRIRLPGYVVPLEESKDGLREFLLVPYFGACLHTPPPPANQIVFIRSKTPVKGFRTMDTVWVNGTLAVDRSRTEMGASTYNLTADSVTRYTAPK